MFTIRDKIYQQHMKNENSTGMWEGRYIEQNNML